ncbi:MAG: YicC family protein [Bacteroidales bacterium]|nr:YicC family protein [Bacteroidales bacterium]
MTGYGKAGAMLENGKLTIEIRSVNGKNADISIKSPLLPKDREIEVRKRLADALQRGSIDMFITWEPNAADGARQVNRELAMDYFRQIRQLSGDIGAFDPMTNSVAGAEILSAVLRMPDVVDVARKDVVTEENWPAVSDAIDEAIRNIVDYRSREGAALYKDVTGRIRTILALYDEVEGFEPERISAVRGKLLKAAEDLGVKLDPERFEQEMIFYLEKLDINEEKVRLRQHCKYFMDTIDGEPYPGRKLGFIIQEMGREINTTGSKANHAGIQKCVVRMKDELEKIREQSMNIL